MVHRLDPKWPHDNTHVEVMQPSCSKPAFQPSPPYHPEITIITNITITAALLPFELMFVMTVFDHPPTQLIFG